MYSLPQLPYDYAALEPYIDAQTMEIHHTKHHQAYLDKANAALANLPDWQHYTGEEILRKIDQIPSDLRQTIINNLGGHVNHSFFWQVLTPSSQAISDYILVKIAASFGSWQRFQTQFQETALSRFGSGWAWLVVNQFKDLEIISTPNQDSPLMQGLIPILGLDVWEHAYYLRYQNRRADYIQAWWHVVNWQQVETNYSNAV